MHSRIRTFAIALLLSGFAISQGPRQTIEVPISDRSAIFKARDRIIDVTQRAQKLTTVYQKNMAELQAEADKDSAIYNAALGKARFDSGAKPDTEWAFDSVSMQFIHAPVPALPPPVPAHPPVAPTNHPNAAGGGVVP